MCSTLLEIENWKLLQTCVPPEGTYMRHYHPEQNAWYRVEWREGGFFECGLCYERPPKAITATAAFMSI